MLEINASWPVCGKPNIIHVDNGSDFHSNAEIRGLNETAVSSRHVMYKFPLVGSSSQRL